MHRVWSAFERIQCQCHCHSCIQNRHVQIRRLSTIAARLRSGQTGQRVRLDRTSCPPQPTVLRARTWGQRNVTDGTFRRVNDEVSRSRKADQECEEPPAKDVKRSKEDRLGEIAHDLQSLDINHWTVEDVVTYEPRPGGQRPPNVPTSVAYDPNTMAPQSPWSSESLKTQNYDRIWTLKKTAKMETAIARFTTKICLLTEIHSQWPSNLLALPEAVHPYVKLPRRVQKSLLYLLAERSDTLRNMFSVVEANNPPPPPEDLLAFLPKYQQYEDGWHHELLRDLNESLVKLFDAFKNQSIDLKTLLLKICHNLLVSAAPPNVQTMNVLLLGFYSLGSAHGRLHWDVKAIVVDYLTEICLVVKIRPNEVTCATILAAYRQRNLQGAFSNFIQRMRATVPEALMFTNELMLNNTNNKRLVPAKDKPNVFRQAVHPSPMIFSEVIKGLAKFCSVKEAIEVCKDFSAKDWGYDWACIRHLLMLCIRDRDWESGQWVWQQIKDFNGLGHAVPIKVYAAMLAVCVNCSEEAMFTTVLTYAQGTLRPKSEVVLVDLATKILTQSVEYMDDSTLSQYEGGKVLRDSLREEDQDLSLKELERHPQTKKAMFGKHDPEFVNQVFAREDSILDAVSRVGGRKAMAGFVDGRKLGRNVTFEDNEDNVRFLPGELLKQAEGGIEFDDELDDRTQVDTNKEIPDPEKEHTVAIGL